MITNPNIILPQNSDLYHTLNEAAQQRRIVLFAGLPGVGKSLYLQQLSLLAHENGRFLHSLQWDVSRLAFEVEAILNRYPEVDSITHPMIRKATGLWARQGVQQWHETHPDPRHMLVGEVPLVGNRLVELAQRRGDGVESLLASEQTEFFLPVPSREIRALIEQARARTIAQPRHANEAYDAPPHVLQINWRDIYELGEQIGLVATVPEGEIPYDPEVYTAVYAHLLQHRHLTVLPITERLKNGRSVYDLNIPTTKLQATPAEAIALITHLETTIGVAAVERQVEGWYIV